MQPVSGRDQGEKGAGALHVRLFGVLDLRKGGMQLPSVSSVRARSLLAYLLVHGHAPQPRERLAFLLWPDSTESQARTNLRHLLHTLRRASPEVDAYLEVTLRTLRWRTELPCWVDVAAFEATVLRAAEVEHGSVHELGELREAIDLYSGDLLEGSYDEWLVEERERLRDRYLSVLKRAAELLVGTGRYGEAVSLGRELLRRDPLSEYSYRLLMRAHGAAGDRAAAVRVYHECVATLHRELGVEPSSATKAAYDALMRTDADQAQAQPPPPATVTALVGRDAELKRLVDCWRDAERGRAQLVLVTGEAGVGKTRLVEELAGWCGHRGAVVAVARSYADEGELGYGVVITWLRTAEVAARLRRLPASDKAQLARLLPELVDEAQAVVPPAPEPEAAEQRRRLFEAAGRALAGSGRPTLLIADDTQWCDEQSLQLTHHVLRRNPDSQLLVVGTVRREDLDDAHPLEQVGRGLQAADRASEIGLGRLQPADTEALARSVAGRDLDDATLAALYAETEGNPLFVVEAVRAGWKRGGPDRSNVTPKVQAVIGARLRQLSDPARELAEMAATVGRSFTADVIGRAAGLDDVSLVRGLDELWRRRIVREQGIDSYDFAHGRIRDVAYDSQGPARRRRNHLLIAKALCLLHGHELDALSGEIARHYDRGARPEEAVAWYRRAATQAQRLHADVDAVRLLARARELVEALPDGGQRRALELAVLSALPTPLAVVDGFASPQLAEVQGRVLDLSRLAGVRPDPALLRSLVMSNLCRKDFEGARAAAAGLRESADRSGAASKTWCAPGAAGERHRPTTG